jgi:hypothetical protein
MTLKRAPVLTLWASIIAERLGHSRDTALTLGRAVAGPTARLKVRIVGREYWNLPSFDQVQRRDEQSAQSVFLLGKTIRLLPDANGELRAAFRTLPMAGLEVADEFLPANPAEVENYLVRTFGDHLTAVRAAMEELASRYDLADLNRIGIRLYEKFRPALAKSTKKWDAPATLVEKIRAVA